MPGVFIYAFTIGANGFFALAAASSLALATIASTLTLAPARKSTSPRITPSTTALYVQT
jgi:hypothetical protein